jgi:hypothetical protein
MKPPLAVDERFRSLLQKAVRRGHTELVTTVCALIDSQGPQPLEWFEKRTAAIVFAECWPLGAELRAPRGVPGHVAALCRATAAPKLRDATGLGLLAYGLACGDAGALDGTPQDRDVRLIARAVANPPDFWNWVVGRPVDDPGRNLIAMARRAKRSARPHDKAVAQAAAYLAATTRPPGITPAAGHERAFPYWVVFDRHTPQGKRVLRDVARDLHIPLPHLEWIAYFFEGAQTNAEIPSQWWQKYCQWRFRRIGVRQEEAHLIWAPAQLQIADALAEDSRLLQSELYRWKLSNLERIEALKRQMNLFWEHTGAARPDQAHLF